MMTNPESPNPTPVPTAAPTTEPASAPLAESREERSPIPLEGSGTVSDDAPTAQEQFEDLDPLLSFADLIHTLTDYEMQRVDPETGQVLTVEEIKVNMPIELRVSVDDAGQVTLKGAAPTQRTETTVLPVFHQMQVRIVEDRHGQ